MRHTHYSHRGFPKLRLPLGYRLGINIIAPVLIVVATMLSVHVTGDRLAVPLNFNVLSLALGISFGRIMLAYLIAMVVGVLLALIATSSPRTEALLLPLYDVLESVPILVFFPVIIAFFINYQLFNVAAIVILCLNMIWNIIFSTISGLKVIPQDLQAVGKIFGLSKTTQFFKITLPALIPFLITGSLLAWAEGWNMLIVAEVLHTYIPHTTEAADLFGIGSLLVNASADGNTGVFVETIAVIIIAVVVVNLGIWQPLLHLSERYKFES